MVKRDCVTVFVVCEVKLYIVSPQIFLGRVGGTSPPGHPLTSPVVANDYPPLAHTIPECCYSVGEHISSLLLLLWGRGGGLSLAHMLRRACQVILVVMM